MTNEKITTCFCVPLKSVKKKIIFLHPPIEVVMIPLNLKLILVTSAGLNLFSGLHVKRQRMPLIRNAFE